VWPGLAHMCPFPPHPCIPLPPCRLLREHRSHLESFIFDRGTDGLATALCVDRLALCDVHALMDSGEL